MKPTVLVIAGSASDGAAGLQADLGVVGSLGLHPACAVTAVTSQNTLGVSDVHVLPPEVVRRQVASVASDLDVRAVKIGMLASMETVSVVREALWNWGFKNIVFDPVMTAQSDGSRLLDDSALESVKSLVGRCDVVTPNSSEASRLTGMPVSGVREAEEAAGALRALGAGSAVVTGVSDGGDVVDVLVSGESTRLFKRDRIATSTHGGGCVFSSALACYLALGKPVSGAAEAASAFAYSSIERACDIGKGIRSVQPSLARGEKAY